ncbi:MAG: beta-propeller domain-containing protein [Myxococcales bacterium]
MARRALVFLGVAAALSVDCGNGRPTPPGIRADVRLRAAADCESLNRQIQDLAIDQMRATVEAYRGPIVFAAAAPAAAPASFSTTNIQVPGVDEADVVKNDGTRIFTLADGALWAARSWPPQDLAIAGHLPIEGYAQSLFLDGDRVVVLSQVPTQEAGAGAAAMAPCPLFSDYCLAGNPATKITVVDVSALSAPAVRAELYLPGYVNEARRIGSSVILISQDSVRWPRDIRYFGADTDALEERNEAIIRATPVEAWFPPGSRKLADGTSVDLGYRCGDFYLPDAPERLGHATIGRLDLDHLDAGISRTSIVGEVSQIHATPTTLYLASEHFWWWPEPGQRDFTYLHRFDISEPGRAIYVASGGVEGHLGDQFALDDRDGLLRVAATTISSGSARGFGSHVAVLGLREESGTQRLAVIGDTGPLVQGENIFAARFVGDKGFVVTFRSFDPLVTLDLRDPAHPRKVAELTEPGFSRLLQPIDDGHLLALGIDLPDPDPQGRLDESRRAVKLSLYDVTDLAHPRRTSQILVGTSSGWTAALWDHHAFNWYPERKLLGLPFSDWAQPPPGQPWYDRFVSDLRLFSVDAASGIAPLGALSMADVYLKVGSGEWTSWYRPWVSRGVMATAPGGDDFVYAISDAGLRSAALSNLGSPLATALFPASP